MNNIKEIIKGIDGVFKLPKKKYYLGRIKNYVPYFEPMGFSRSIIKVRKLIPLSDEELAKNMERGYGWTKIKWKNMPMVRRTKDYTIRLFGNSYWVQIGKPWAIAKSGLGWKDKYNCYDKETKVLTKSGWKYFKDVTYNDEILCLNDDGVGEYHKPSHITDKHYKGKMYHLNSTGVNLMVTPNHNLYVARGNKYGRYKSNTIKKFDFEFCKPSVYFGKTKRFLKSFEWIAEDVETITIPEYKFTKKGNSKGVINHYTMPEISYNMDDFLRLLGIFIADGRTSGGRGEIAIENTGSEKGAREQEKIKKLLNRMDIKFSIASKHKQALAYKIYSIQLNNFLRENCGKRSSSKKVPFFVKQLSKRQINLFLDWLFMGDGCKSKTSHIYGTCSERLSEDVEELIVKGGKTFYTYEVDNIGKEFIIDGRTATQNHKFFATNWLQSRNDININLSTIKKSNNYKEEWINYDDNVYCVTVPYNKLFVKRGGRGVWCGNSPRYEWPAFFHIWFFNWQFCITWVPPVDNCDKYWEMVLWYLFYYDEYGTESPDITEARKSWGWSDMETGESTWDDSYLI